MTILNAVSVVAGPALLLASMIAWPAPVLLKRLAGAGVVLFVVGPPIFTGLARKLGRGDRSYRGANIGIFAAWAIIMGVMLAFSGRWGPKPPPPPRAPVGAPR